MYSAPTVRGLSQQTYSYCITIVLYCTVLIQSSLSYFIALHNKRV